MRHHGLLRKVLLLQAHRYPSHWVLSKVSMSTCDLQTSTNTITYSPNKQTPWPVLYSMPPFRCWSLNWLAPLHAMIFSLARFPLRTYQSFPVFHSCFTISNTTRLALLWDSAFVLNIVNLALLQLLGVRYHQNSGDKLWVTSIPTVSHRVHATSFECRPLRSKRQGGAEEKAPTEMLSTGRQPYRLHRERDGYASETFVMYADFPPPRSREAAPSPWLLQTSTRTAREECRWLVQTQRVDQVTEVRNIGLDATRAFSCDEAYK
jgi:hypothetical protein